MSKRDSALPGSFSSSTSNAKLPTYSTSFTTSHASNNNFAQSSVPLLRSSSASSNNSVATLPLPPPPPPHTLSPHEEALQSLCKQILKSRIFRGFYEERRYVEALNGYRDIVALQRGERELEKVLLDIRNKLSLFYQHTAASSHWIGISQGGGILASGQAARLGSLETCIWTEFDDLAFGQYWFSIKSLRFRDREIVLKLKMVRPVEAESSAPPIRRRLSSSTSVERHLVGFKSTPMTAALAATTSSAAVGGDSQVSQSQIELQDFVEIARQWGSSIKQTAYEFLAQDINKDNIKGLLRFIGLLVVSLLSGLLAAIKFLGVFTLRFLFEVSRLAHVLTPVALKLIDFFNKIVGGFYILLTMIWKDAVINRGRPKNNFQEALEYNPPAYQSIEYNVRQQQRRSDEFERKLQ